MKKHLAVCLLLAVLVVGLSGCAKQGISKEPTPYTASYYEGSHFKTLYFTEDHPDVVAVKTVVDATVQRLMNYDWQSSPAVEERVLGNGQKWGEAPRDYKAHQLSFQLQSYEFEGIAYTLNAKKEGISAETQVGAVISFTSATPEWLQMNGLKLGEEYAINLQIRLSKEDDEWVFRGVYPSPLNKN